MRYTFREIESRSGMIFHRLYILDMLYFYHTNKYKNLVVYRIVRPHRDITVYY